MNLIERIASAMRERRILRHCREGIALQRAGDPVGARVAFRRMQLEKDARTDAQRSRMERAQRLERRTHG